eukprot:TRINITY_DN1035_c0_g3_i1.p1 TRINITY_DN1035_c0_g3~~TRINITY_DN1035_c0_g3_i1.p1  ORF type:complete len:465 (-),score=79.26 TRINITY_DN1035_c0_g3_i1:278-1672(-)
MAKHFNGEQLFFSYTLVCPNPANSLKIEEIFKSNEKLEEMMVSTFVFQPDFFTKLLSFNVPMVFITHKLSDDPAVKRFFDQLPNVTHFVPPLNNNGKFGCYHSKFFLLKFQTFIRVCITTSNLSDDDFYAVGQTIWVQDFPKKFEASITDLTCIEPPSKLPKLQFQHGEFESEFRNYLKVARIPKKHIDRFFDDFDFCGAKCKLIASVPGSYDVKGCKYGQVALKRLVEAKCKVDVNGPHRLPEFVYMSSSVGKLTKPYLSSFLASCMGHFDKDCDMKFSPTNFKLVYPAIDTVQLEGLEASTGVLCFQAKHFSSPGFPPRILHDLHLHPEFTGLGMHAKILAPVDLWKYEITKRNSTSNTNSFTGVGNRLGGGKITSAKEEEEKPKSKLWYFTGSHNMSGAAWGSLNKAQTKLFMMNYELGMFFEDGVELVDKTSQFGGVCLPYRDLTPYRDDQMPVVMGKET